MKYFVKSITIFITAVIIITMCSCSLRKQGNTPAEVKSGLNQESYLWVNETHSRYGYNQLEEKLRKAYDDIVEAWFALEDSIITEKIDGDDLSDITNNILHDYPIITWIDKQYSYKNILVGTKIKFNYTMDKPALQKYISELTDRADELVEDIEPETTGFDKAVAVHDRLIELVEYNREAEHQDEAYGALIDNQAACQGYAKAYQLLMLKLGIECLVVFGDSTEPHAWNMVELDDGFYFVDVTFDDRVITDGGEYLSHEYMLLSDAQYRKTHTPSGNGARFKLPECNSLSNNYFVKNNMIISETNLQEFTSLLKSQARRAAEKRAGQFQIKIANAELAKQIEQEQFATGFSDNSINTALSEYSHVEYRGRTFDEISNIYTFILEYK